MPLTEKIGMISQGLGALGQAANIMGIGQKKQDERQLKQQQALTGQQVNAQKELAQYQQDLGLDMWNKTNYKAQVDHLKQAGLNPALLYGKGGGGGATVGMGINTGVNGGQAANAAATQQANTATQQQMAMMGAQLKLLEAQTKNIEADTANKPIAGREGEARAASIEFQNELNKTIGLNDMVDRYKWANQKLEVESAKQLAEYNAWQTANFQGMASDDPNSPMAKAIKAGLDKTLEDLKQAKLNNDATAATNVVKQFEARLAEQGIHPHSPWWTKLLTDMLEKVGITNAIGQTEKKIKTTLQ